jgi:serine/threonine-protein kinase RsbW
MSEKIEFKDIKIDDKNELFDTTGMFYKEFQSDYRQIRYFTLLVVQKAPPEIKEINLLEQQVSELIKNAVKHGNKNQIDKKVKVWYSFTSDSARLIVEDEGEGFKNIEEWNTFNKKRTECFVNQDFENMAEFVSFRTTRSDENDGGNALFAAVEYWNAGVVFTSKRNCIGVMKKFPQKRYGVQID